MDELSAHELAFVIFWAIKNFALLEKRLTPAMSTFLHWFGAAEPRLLKKPNSTHAEFYKSIEGLRGASHDLYSKETLLKPAEGHGLPIAARASTGNDEHLARRHLRRYKKKNPA